MGAIRFVQLVFILLSFAFGVLQIPSLVNSIFSGRSCESALPEPSVEEASMANGSIEKGVPPRRLEEELDHPARALAFRTEMLPKGCRIAS